MVKRRPIIAHWFHTCMLTSSSGGGGGGRQTSKLSAVDGNALSPSQWWAPSLLWPAVSSDGYFFQCDQLERKKYSESLVIDCFLLNLAPIRCPGLLSLSFPSCPCSLCCPLLSATAGPAWTENRLPCFFASNSLRSRFKNGFSLGTFGFCVAMAEM